jgi:hypothetical protein
MQVRKSVIGIMGILFFVLVLTMINDYGNLVSSEGIDGDEKNDGRKDNPYKDIIADINSSLRQTDSNRDRIESIDNELAMYRDNFKDILEEYILLGEEIEKKVDDVEMLRGKMNKTMVNSDELKENLLGLKEQVEENEEKFNDDIGIRIGMFYLAGFVLMNLLVWLQMSNYYKNRSFEYKRY